jgi:hypothetical protein
MAAEFEELRLQINLQDNASAGLQNIRKEIAALGATNIDVVARGLRDLGVATTPIGERARATGDALGRVILGFARSTVQAIAIENTFSDVENKLKDFVKTMVALGNLGRETGVNVAQIKALEEQARLFNVPIETVHQALRGFSRALGELSYNSDLVRELRERAGVDIDTMSESLEKLREKARRGDTVGAMRDFLRGVRNMEKVVTGQFGEAAGRKVREEILAKVGIPPEMMRILEDLRIVSQEEKDAADAQLAAAQALNREWVLLSESLRRFKETIYSAAIEPMTELVKKGREAVEYFEQKWAGPIGEAVKFGIHRWRRAAAGHGRRRHRPGWRRRARKFTTTDQSRSRCAE